MSPQPSPIALSDIAMAQVMSACRPLSMIDRTRFLQLLAERLNGRREIGDGEIYRLCAVLQKELFAYPLKTEPAPQHERKMRER
jgi:hypothetical protein